MISIGSLAYWKVRVALVSMAAIMCASRWLTKMLCGEPLASWVEERSWNALEKIHGIN